MLLLDCTLHVVLSMNNLLFKKIIIYLITDLINKFLCSISILMYGTTHTYYLFTHSYYLFISMYMHMYACTAEQSQMEQVEVDYISMPGRNTNISGVKSFAKLPLNASIYVEKFVELVGIPSEFN